MEFLDYDSAQRVGAMYYYRAEPCKHGHEGPWYTKSRACVKCACARKKALRDFYKVIFKDAPMHVKLYIIEHPTERNYPRIARICGVSKGAVIAAFRQLNIHRVYVCRLTEECLITEVNYVRLCKSF